MYKMNPNVKETYKRFFNARTLIRFKARPIQYWIDMGHTEWVWDEGKQKQVTFREVK